MPENFRPNRRTALAMGVAVTAAALSIPAHAAGGVTLFKIVTPKDDMFVGITAEEFEKLGAGAPVEVLAKKIAAEGQMTFWQYGVKHGEQGQLVFAPTGKVSVFAAGVVRIEPYKAAYEVIAPTP
ncbi:MAG: hypothetical protein ACLPID_07650 [Beijerinckiaceae bacterium]